MLDLNIDDYARGYSDGVARVVERLWSVAGQYPEVAAELLALRDSYQFPQENGNA